MDYIWNNTCVYDEYSGDIATIYSFALGSNVMFPSYIGMFPNKQICFTNYSILFLDL